MILSQYLHADIVDTLRMFGNLDDVVNRILDASDEGHFDVADKPECRSRDGCSRYDINVTNESYINLLKVRGVQSKAISLRRLLYWFVENEVYNDLDWEPINDYIDRESKRVNKLLDKICSCIDKLELLTGDDYSNLRNKVNEKYRS